MPVRPKDEDWSEETSKAAAVRNAADQDDDTDPEDDVPPADDQPGLDPPTEEPDEG